MAIKTLKGWEKSNLDLDEYLGPGPCRINEELSSYIGECVPPKYTSEEFTQGGDPHDHETSEDGDFIGYYMTVKHVEGKYFYLGVLPEFKQ